MRRLAWLAGLWPSGFLPMAWPQSEDEINLPSESGTTLADGFLAGRLVGIGSKLFQSGGWRKVVSGSTIVQPFAVTYTITNRFGNPVQVVRDAPGPGVRRDGVPDVASYVSLAAFSSRPTSVPANAAGGAFNISRDAATIVGYIDNGFSTPYLAFRWTEATGIVDLGTLVPTNPDAFSGALDLSDDGSVVVGFSMTGGASEHAFRWTEGGVMADLGTGAGASNDFVSRAYGVSADGSVVVGQSHFPPPYAFSLPPRLAFRWTQGTGFESPGTLETGGNSIALAVTADGSVVVGRASKGVQQGNTIVGRTRAFRWKQGGGMVDLGVLPGFEYSTATGVSDDGSVVVGVCSSGVLDNAGVMGALRYDEKNSRAFLWTEMAGMRDLTQRLTDAGVHTTGRSLVAAVGISPDGKWISAVTTRPDPEFPGLFVDRLPVLASLTETLPPWSRLLNLSTRGPVLTGDSVLIPGFVIRGTGNKKLLIRVVGPGLLDLGVAGVLANPTLALKRTVGNSTVDIAGNDNWGSVSSSPDTAAATIAAGAFELTNSSKDAALVVHLLPGVYTVEASGVGGATGNALVEVYALE